MEKHMLVRTHDLYFSQFYTKNISVVPQSWKVRKNYYDYENSGRPISGLILMLEGTVLSYKMPSGKEVTVKEGDILYLPRDSHYSMTVITSNSKNWIHDYLVNFDLFTPEGNLILLSEEPFIINSEKNTFVISTILELSVAVHCIHPSPLRSKQLFYQLLEYLIRNSMNNNYDYYPIKNAIKYLEKNWNQNIKNSELANMCGMSESHFRKVFGKWAGMGPAEYRNHIRISNAKAMLIQGSMPIGDIANALGYEDRFYFSRAFKKATGMTPSEYKTL